MSERSEWIGKIKNNYRSRVSYTKAKISVNIASQVKALRRRRDMKQIDLAIESDMKQSRISAIERPGSTGLSIETLVRLASAFKVGLIVKFVPFSEMIRWENSYSQDSFDVLKIDDDTNFINPKNYQDLSSTTTPVEKSMIIDIHAGVIYKQLCAVDRYNTLPHVKTSDNEMVFANTGT